jgi:hypothetical protein
MCGTEVRISTANTQFHILAASPDGGEQRVVL